ncbi:hypothetical protein DL768_010893 [Monosporascus sp. mg162]|nr:hypothetical protein DL768_010893 [Monosporascus sp. mg162]
MFPRLRVFSLQFVVTFHVGSDTTLQITNGDAVTKFMVSSGSVATASPAWREMLYGQDAKPGSSKGDWLVAIDAHPKALSILLRFVHYQFHKVPAELPLDDLYELTLLTSRNQCLT